MFLKLLAAFGLFTGVRSTGGPSELQSYCCYPEDYYYYPVPWANIETLMTRGALLS